MIENEKPDYDPKLTAKKALGELFMAAGAVAGAAALAVLAEWLSSGAAALILPPKWVWLAVPLAALGRGLTNYLKNRDKDQK